MDPYLKIALGLLAISVAPKLSLPQLLHGFHQAVAGTRLA
ncbi:Cadherin-4 precursor [Candidatus Methylacidithermus pantelleriae]|uniref:Cadherin-4 n=1 Tax=Candidatus Methylacidithermus pantelleriae TaxID=2744239 RepID=A0A8J2BKJ4_9BACT|nr:Cadherin-4 precursor [Candidatus Methylacidithermus pantelleriae]